ncbi:penicillin-binding protein [Chondromyces crocatus]|nr:penicillin-binding protein [Chondromyces crocatus]
MGILCAVMAAGLGAIVSGAYRIEVEDGPEWFELAERQRQRRLHITPKRGTIFDRNGAPLAESVEVPSVSLDAVEMLRGIEPQYVPMRTTQYAERIAQALHLPVEEVAEKISRRRRFAWLKRRISESEVEAIRALSDRSERHPIRGLVIEGEGRRFYPNRELAGNLLGFVAPDGEGKEGLELSLETQLRGEASEVRGLRDRSGKLIFSETISNEQALAGHNVYLTIDKVIQFTAERELQAALGTYEAHGGSIVIVDPATGEILAMASAPGYNPNDYSNSDPAARRNRCVVDRFEPGSTMKVFTMAAALAAKTISPSASLYCEEGRMAIDNVVIHDTHPAKWLSPTQMLSLSSNIGMAKIGLGLGEQRLYEGFRRFGFGDITGVPLPGESSGVLRPRGRPWVQVETASSSFGQGISVTTLQLAMAMASIANNGRLMEPVLVSQVSDSTGLSLMKASPKVRREVVPGSVARLVSDMLVAVTEGEGTGVEAAIPGFRVAGKTATAQKIDPATGRYTDTHYVASFVGFIPAERPRVSIAVVLDEPMGGTYAGGSVAGPVFRRVGEMVLRHLGVAPRGSDPIKLSEVAKQAGSSGLGGAQETPGQDETEPRPLPTPNSAALRSGGTSVPHVKGLPAREAVRALLSLGLTVSMEGSGRIAHQDPAPGSIVPKGTTVRLVFESPS